MANYELDLTATEINAALTKAHAPDTTLTGTLSSDPSLVTAGAVKLYVDNSATPTETSSDGITDTDTAVPTSAAVKDHVSDATKNSFTSGLTSLTEQRDANNHGTGTYSGTAATSGFLIIVAFDSSYNTSSLSRYVNIGTTSATIPGGYNTAANLANGILYMQIPEAGGIYTIPIGRNESYFVKNPLYQFAYYGAGVYFKPLTS